MSAHNYHQIECQQDKETEREIRSCRTEHHQLTCVLLPVMMADVQRSFISNEPARCVLYSAPMLDLIKTRAAACNILIWLILPETGAWTWAMVLSAHAALRLLWYNQAPASWSDFQSSESWMIRNPDIEMMKDKDWYNAGRPRLGCGLFIVCQNGVSL